MPTMYSSNATDEQAFLSHYCESSEVHALYHIIPVAFICTGQPKTDEPAFTSSLRDVRCCAKDALAPCMTWSGCWVLLQICDQTPGHALHADSSA